MRRCAVPRAPSDFFDQETDRYRHELAQAENDLAVFDSKEGIVTATTQKQLVLQQLSEFETQFEQAKANAHEADRRAAALRETDCSHSRKTNHASNKNR